MRGRERRHGAGMLVASRRHAMDDRHAVEKDLKRLVRGEVRFDDLSRVLYSTAACMYQQEPLGIIVPRDENDVQTVVRYAAERGLPLLGRGAGSSLNGQVIGQGLVLDFTKYLRRIVHLDPGERRAVVQPGVVLKELNRALAPYGLQFAPDPSSGAQATLGGMIGANAAGPRSLKYGSTRDHLVQVRAVTASGNQLVAPSGGRAAESEQRRLENELHTLLTRHAGLIERCRPKVTKNSSGYCLSRVLTGDEVNLIPLLAGSEGTLALVVEATLKLLPVPPARGLVLFFFAELEAAGEAVLALRELGPSALEIVDHTFLELARVDNAEALAPVPEGTRYLLLTEFEEESSALVAEKLAAGRRRVVDETALAFAAQAATDPAEQERLWNVRKAATPVLNRMKGPRRPWSVIEDAAVPPERLVDYIRGIHELVEAHGVHTTLHGHAGNGHLHIRPILDLKRADDLETLKSLAQAAAGLVRNLGGTLSAEHGDGLCRTEFLPRVFPELYPLFVRVKDLFDPHRLLNPGKKVFVEGWGMADHLRYGPAYRRVPTHTPFEDESLQTETERCHGCGSCRDYCPVCRATRDETATARAKANLLRHVISGRLPADVMETRGFKQVMDLCVNCKQCVVDCPTLVDIPRLAQTARTVYVSKHGQEFRNQLLGRSDLTSRFGQATWRLANTVNELQPWRTVMERVVGIHRRRRLPRFAPESFRKWLAAKGFRVSRTLFRAPAYPGARKGNAAVVYFPGCFAQYCDSHGEAVATTEVLRRNGFDVLVPEFRCCGIALLTLGSGAQVVPDAEFNVAQMLPHVRRGIPVVVSSASCCLALKEDYPRLLKTEAAAQVSAHLHDVHTFLWELHRQGRLDTGSLAPVRRRVAYHNPCHLRALGVVHQPKGLLQLVPGLELVDLDDSCCGIAGTFGMKTENFELSLQMGAPLFAALKAARVEVVASGCGTCNIQIQQGARLPVVHPLSLLAEAYTG